MTEAIVLAGGLGTRLRSVVPDMPKPMALVQDKPFLEYLLEYLNKQGVTKAILSVGYMWQEIEKYFGDRFKNIDLVYSVENEPLGTGGAIKQALGFVESEYVYVLNGDTFFAVDLNKLYLGYTSKATLALKPMVNFDRYGCVEFDNDYQVTAFTEKTFREKGAINGGVYLLFKNLFDSFDVESKFSFEEFLEKNFQNLKISVKVFDQYFIDIGIPEDYARAQKELQAHI